MTRFLNITPDKRNGAVERWFAMQPRPSVEISLTKGSYICPDWRYIGSFMRDISMLCDIAPNIGKDIDKIFKLVIE
jgi:hypothetical protein